MRRPSPAHRLTSYAFALIAAAWVPGCVPGGSGGGGDDPADGAPADGAAVPDGGPATDADPLTDGGPRVDAAPDGGPLVDAGDGGGLDGGDPDGGGLDMTPPCVEGDTDAVACGLNGRGELPRVCEAGAWVPDGPCDDPDVCVDGALDERACLGDGVERRACVDGAYTAFGPCEGGCVDECAPGDPICDGDAVAPCVDVDDDPCLERAPPQPCADPLVCREGACVELPTIIINEVFYDQVGGDGSEVFIELWGPPGASVDDLTLYGVNGNGGVDYATMPLAGVIGGDGYYLIVDADASPALRELSDYGSVAADLQNGPDAVQLRRGDAVLDAVHYGEGGDFGGEGAPAVDPPEGQSISRADQLDTDDNAADFRAADPSPRGEPGSVVCEAPGDVDTRACGFNGRGEQSRTCQPDGLYGPYGRCIDPDDCVDGDRETGPCGLDDRGELTITCVEGQWVEGDCIEMPR